MRTFAMTTLVLALATSPAWAIGGGGHGGGGGGNNSATTKLKVVNDSENAVMVIANGGTPITLEPNGSQELSFTTSKTFTNTITVTLTATIEGTLISDTESASIKVGNRATATITAPTSSSLSIAFSGGGLAKVAVNRDSSVALASSGGLLPLLWLSILLGRQPRRRDNVADSAERTSDAI
jgi:hypothetical protein